MIQFKRKNKERPENQVLPAFGIAPPNKTPLEFPHLIHLHDAFEWK